MIILYWLGEYGTLRHNALHRLIGKISFKMLSSTLKELESDGLVIRKVYPQMPPKVEYSLSQKGKSNVFYFGIRFDTAFHVNAFLLVSTIQICVY